MSDIPILVDDLLENISRRKSIKESVSKRPKLDELVRVTTNDIDACHVRYDKIHDYIYSFNLSNTQRKFASLALNVMARTFYGKLFDVHRPTILLRNGWTEKGCTRILRLLSGRRIGKSWLMAIIITALMLYMVGYTFVVFGPVTRQSQWIGEKVAEFIKTTAPHVLSRMKTRVDGSIFLDNGAAKETKLLCLPCNETVRHLSLARTPLPLQTKHSSSTEVSRRWRRRSYSDVLL